MSILERNLSDNCLTEMRLLLLHSALTSSQTFQSRVWYKYATVKHFRSRHVFFFSFFLLFAKRCQVFFFIIIIIYFFFSPARSRSSLRQSQMFLFISCSANDPHFITFRLYVVTWNVAQKYPDSITLNDLLDIDMSCLDKSLPDIFIVGLQEVNANPQNIMSNLFKSDPWVQKMKDLLKPLEYLVAKTEQLQGLLMTVFMKRKHLYHIREIESEYTKTGFGGMWVSYAERFDKTIFHQLVFFYY